MGAPAGVQLQPRRTLHTRIGLGAALAVALLHGAAVQAGRSESSSPSRAQSAARISLIGGMATWRLQLAVHDAHRALARPACQEVFHDFRDLSGEPLSEVLSDRGITCQDQLDLLLFRDGSHKRKCQTSGILAVAVPGRDVIWICPVQFRRVARDRTQAEAVVIHELLHSLGLGENPPSSREITAQILKRCRT